MASNDFMLLADIVGAAMELAPEHRRAYAQERCSGNPELLREAIRLISASEKAPHSLLDSPASSAIAESKLHFPDERFELIEKIGEGGFGIVFKALEKSTQQLVAIKTLRFWASPEAIDRLRQEASVLRRIDHPGVVRVLEVESIGTTFGDLLFMVMEYIAGQSLVRFANDHAMLDPQRVRLFLRLCDSVEAVHQLNIVHRDLKPANVLVTTPRWRPGLWGQDLNDAMTDVQPKLLDFGLARLCDGVAGCTMHTRSGVRMGTPRYMSPEQWEGNAAAADVRSDVYGVGLMLAELLSGFVPAEGDGIRPAFESPAAIETLIPGRLRRYREIVKRATQYDPASRYASVDELARDVSALMDGHASAALPGPGPAKRSVLNWVLSILLIALGAGLVWIVAALVQSVSAL